MDGLQNSTSAIIENLNKALRASGLDSEGNRDKLNNGTRNRDYDLT